MRERRACFLNEKGDNVTISATLGRVYTIIFAAEKH